MKRALCQCHRVGSHLWTDLIVATLFALSCVFFVLLSRDHRHGYAWEVRQTAQLRSIEPALGLFSYEFGAYPPSDANDVVGLP